MQKFFCLLLALVCTVSVAQKKSASKDRLAGVDAKLQSLLADWHVAGFAVAVVEKNKVIYAKGFGYRDWENKKPVTPNTLFAIGSCTKAFTSGLLGILRNEDKISFDQKPSTYVPELKFFNDEMNDNVTVKDMMCHRTGLPRHDLSWYFFNTPSRDSLIQRMRYMEPSAHVRERWQYNNFMFMAQGVITEKITGKSWETNITERFFKPLGMNTSNTSIDEMRKSAEPSKGYNTKNDNIEFTDYYNISGMAPAGSINSSVNEMANWVRMWINGGKFDGKEILPSSYIAEAASSQMAVAGSLPSKEHPEIHFANYGYGWGMASYKGHYRVEHGGNIDGFSANTAFYPSDSLGIIVLVNQNASTVPSIVRNIIADRMLGVTITDWSKELKDAADKGKKEEAETKKKATSGAKKGTKPSHLLEDYEGKYSLDGYGTFTITTRHDSLFAKAGKFRYWLKHYHYDVFQPFDIDTKNKIDTADQTNMRFNFVTGLSGDVDHVTINDLEPTLKKPLDFTRKPVAKEITAAELPKYVGEYEIAGQVAKVFVKAEKTLYLLVPGQPEYELVYLGNNKFAIKALNGFKLEFEQTGNSITGCSFVQPNGTFKAKKKN